MYNGVEYAPRISVQRIAFSDQYPTHIELPVFGSTSLVTAIKKPNAVRANWEVSLFPNPSDGQFSVFVNRNGKYLANIYNTIGEKIMSTEITDQHVFNLKELAKGQYVLEMIDIKDAEQRVMKPFTIN